MNFTFNLDPFCPSHAFYCNTFQKNGFSEIKMIFQEKHQFNFNFRYFYVTNW